MDSASSHLISQHQSEELVEAMAQPAALSRRSMCVGCAPSRAWRRSQRARQCQSARVKESDDEGGQFHPARVGFDEVSRESLDFLQTDHRRRCWIRMEAENPGVVIRSLSLPCTAFSVQARLPPNRPSAKSQRSKMVALSVHDWPTRRRRYSVQEHPARASSRKLEEVRAMLACSTLRSEDDQGRSRPAKERTKWMLTGCCTASPSDATEGIRTLGVSVDGFHLQ